MSRSSSAAVNNFLTAYAQGLANDIRAAQAVVAALCPTVQVGAATGQYKSFDDRNSFSVYATSRGLGGDAKRIFFSATDASFNCKPQALEVTVDQHEREQAGDAPLAQQLLDQGKVRALINATMLSHVHKIVNYVIDNTTAVDARGQWSNAAIDPIDQLDEQLEALTTDVGSTENINLVLSTTTWRALRNHPKVKARASGVKVGAITLDDLKTLLMLPVNVVVGALSYATNKEGQTVAKGQVIGGNAILTYALPNPTVYDPSAFKCFTTGSGNIQSVRTYQEARADIHAIDWSEDLKKTSTLGVKRLQIT